MISKGHIRLMQLTDNQHKQNLEKKLKSAYPLKSEDLSELLDYLNHKLSTIECDHTFKLTERKLSQLGYTPKEIKQAEKWFDSVCGFCDCEIHYNLVTPINDN
ncbi:MAG: DUF2695 domain-containing protein [Cellvibrionaceae bacterium]